MSGRWFFPSRSDRLWIEDLLTTSLLAAQERIERDSVVPTFDIERFRRELASFDFRHEQPFEIALFWAIEQMECGLVHVNHPRYFGLFNPTPTFPAQCAERIIAAFNPQLATWTTSPAAVEIELHVIRAVAERVGLPPETRGHFTTGGAEANYTATILALTKQCPGFESEGARAFAGMPVFYVSRESHLAWIKIAHQVGIGRSAVRLVETDGAGRLSIAGLREAIQRDLIAGYVPFMIAATAGTTNAGMIDPLEACAEIARAHGLWYHVDAAWGGGLIASDTRRRGLAGIEQADSVTIDAHKWFATTMGCGMLLTRWKTLLSAAFRVSTNYMPSEIADLDPYVTSVQWSRRFSGLRLFLSLAIGGWDGYAAHVEHSLAMADVLKQQLCQHGWTIVNQSPVGVLCFAPPQVSKIREIVNRVIASGSAWVSLAVLEGREVIRACVTSGKTTTEDVSVLVAALMRAESSILQQESP